MLITLAFDAHELYGMWLVAHNGPLGLFGKMIEALAEMKSPGACVVVSGGSFRHEFLKSRLKAICDSGHISDSHVVWTDQIEAANS